MTEERYDVLRQGWSKKQLKRRGIHDQRVLTAMQIVPRHLFVPASWRAQAYEDMPLPIGHQQTISQPYIVALMLEALELTGTERVLEVGTGSGYQRRCLGWLAQHVSTVEIIPELAQSARAVFLNWAMRASRLSPPTASIGGKASAPYDALLSLAASPRCRSLWSNSYKREDGSSCQWAIFLRRCFCACGSSRGKSSPRTSAAVPLSISRGRGFGNQAPSPPESAASMREVR